MSPRTSRHRKRMIVLEILAKSILSKSQVYDDVVNPYAGCMQEGR